MKIRLALIPLLLAALAASATAKSAPVPMPTVPATLDKPLPEDAMGVTIRRLPNGLTVYLSPNKGRPRVTIRVAVRAGSKSDPAEATGQAHYLEHMLFKGTTGLGAMDYAKEAPHLQRIKELYEERSKTKDAASRAKIDKLIDAENIADAALVSPNEIDRFYRGIGADGVNAHTSNEETVYEEDIPANRLEAWAAVESERFAHPVFRLFPGELEAVYEEKNRSMDNAESVLYDESEKEMFKAHPYGTQTTIGTIEHLKNPSLARMQAFFDRWYVPNNMAIVLAGDFDPAAAMEIISRNFGSWTPKALPAPTTWPLPKPKGEERYETRYEAEEKVAVSWPTVASSDPDADALTIMDMLTDNSASGLLNLRLNQAQKVKVSGSYPTMRNDAGEWTMWAATKKGQTPEEALALLLETADSLKNGEFDDSDIAAVITDFEIGQKRALESNEARAGTMVNSFIAFEPWPKTASRLERLRRVTKDDVVRVARRYIGPDRVVVFRRDGKPEIPKIDKPGFTSLDIDPARESAFLKRVLAIPAPPIEPRWLVAGRDYQIAPVEGGRIFATKNPYNDLFELTIRFERGSLAERKLCAAVELLELSGAGPYSAEEFKKRLYALGTTINYSCGERSSGVVLSGIDRNFWPSLELLSQRFDWPNVSSDTLRKMVEVDLGERADEKKDPRAVHQALGYLAERGRESPVLHRLTDDELKKLDLNELKGLIHDFPQWQRRVGYVGPRSPSEVAKLLETWGRYKPVPARTPVRYLKPARTRILFTNREMVQAQVGLAAVDEVFDPEHAVDYLFYAQYMGGDMSSVIFQEVREARALAYSAWGGHGTSAHKGDETEIVGGLGCQADKTPEATELMLKLFGDFPASDKRFHETAKAVEEAYRTDPVNFHEIPDRLMSWEDSGITGGDPRPKRFEKVLKYTPAELESFARRFKGKPMNIWILGQRDRVGLDKLKTLGDIEEKNLSDLFPY
ncbi:MAG: M16 family metallopeptidase [Elusimicrobiota bacterium]